MKWFAALTAAVLLGCCLLIIGTVVLFGPAGQCGQAAGPAPNVPSNGTLTAAQLEGLWIAADGPASVAPTEAAIADAESAAEPDKVQKGQPYATRGWGLWQITPGDSEPQFGVDRQLLDPFRNAEAAVAKYRAGGLSQWTTYTSGAYLAYMPSTTSIVPVAFTTPLAGPQCAAAAVGPGGYANPFEHATDIAWERTDQGVDASMAVGSALVALGNSTVKMIIPFFEGEPAVVFQLNDGSLAGRYWYLSEQIAPTVTDGQTVQAGQSVATYAPSGTGIEIGWWQPGPGGYPLGHDYDGNAYDEGIATVPGADFRFLLNALGAGAGTGAGLSSGTTLGTVDYPAP